MKEKYCIQIILITLIGAGLLFSTQPVQAGFFDWFSWSKIQSFFIKERVEEKLPASVSESLTQPEELSESEEVIQPEIDESQQEEKIEKEPEIIIKEVQIEKIIYQDSPELIRNIQILKGQIIVLENKIKELEAKITDLSSRLSTTELGNQAAVFDNIPNFMSVNAKPEYVVGDERTEVKITVIVKNKDGQPISNQLVVFEFLDRLSKRAITNQDGIATLIFVPDVRPMTGPYNEIIKVSINVVVGNLSQTVEIKRGMRGWLEEIGVL